MLFMKEPTRFLALILAMYLESFCSPQALGFEHPEILNVDWNEEQKHDGQLRIVTDRKGVWVAVWNREVASNDFFITATDIVYSRSVDDGATWSSPQRINDREETDTVFHRLPDVATDRKGNWIIVWSSDDSLNNSIGGDFDLFFSVSNDDGLSWSSAVPLNSTAAEDGGVHHDVHVRIDCAVNGNCIAAWKSSNSLNEAISGGSYILFTSSLDSGESWSSVARIGRDNSNVQIVDEEVDVLISSTGTAIAMWSENVIDLNQGADFLEQFSARSTDAGITWDAPNAISENTKIFGIGTHYTSLATDNKGNWVSVWQSANTLNGPFGPDLDIFVSSSLNDGLSWSDPKPITIDAFSDSQDDWNPEIITDTRGTWVVVWQAPQFGGDTNNSNIKIARSIDTGKTWSAVQPLLSDTQIPQRYGLNPVISTNGAEQWIITWAGYIQTELEERDLEIFTSKSDYVSNFPLNTLLLFH